jgi:hypothetical protein
LDQMANEEIQLMDGDLWLDPKKKNGEADA